MPRPRNCIKLAVIILLSGLLFSACKENEISTSYTVTLITNGGTNMHPIPVAHGKPIPSGRISPDPIVSDGGEFLGWYSDPDFQEAYDLDSPVLQDLTLYAKWFYVTNRITFEMGAAETIDPVDVRQGQSLAIDKPVLEGSVFANWYTDADFTQLFNFNAPIVEDMVLYARWVDYSPSEWFEIDGDGVLVACSPPPGTTTVVIPEGVKVIPNWFVVANGLNDPAAPGFPNGRNIQEFILPESLESIGLGAFKFAGITNMTIPPKVTSLDQQTFDGCNQLISFTFAKNSEFERLLGNDGNPAVITAPLLEHISFPPSLQFVGKYTMAGCVGLKTVTFERSESPVIFDSYLPDGGVWLFGGHFPNKIRMPQVVVESFLAELRRVTGDYEFEVMRNSVEGY